MASVTMGLDVLLHWMKYFILAKITILFFLWQIPVVHAVGAETHYPYIPQEVIRECANNTLVVPRRTFCEVMSECILQRVSEANKSTMAAGSAFMALLPTAVWLMAGAMEDVVSIAQRDPWFAFIMSFATGGAKGTLRTGMVTEVDAGNWSTDTELVDRSVNAIIVPALLHEPGNSEVKMRFIRKELYLLRLKEAENEKNAAQRPSNLMFGWLLRFSSMAATAVVLWWYTMREDTCFIAVRCPKMLIAPILVAPLPPLAEYFMASFLEYREYWTVESQNLVCRTYGQPPSSARGVLRMSHSNQRFELPYLKTITPGLPVKQPVCVLVWKRRGAKTGLYRTLLMFSRAFIYIFATYFFSAIVLMPASHATQVFLPTIGLLMYNRLVLIWLDALPHVMNVIQEITVR